MKRASTSKATQAKKKAKVPNSLEQALDLLASLNTDDLLLLSEQARIMYTSRISPLPHELWVHILRASSIKTVCQKDAVRLMF